MDKSFTDIEDKELIEKIKNYQELNSISSFDEAVKRLCDDALEIEKIRHWGDFKCVRNKKKSNLLKNKTLCHSEQKTQEP